jgi:YgiT-type zinc finger domain-containing protein
MPTNVIVETSRCAICGKAGIRLRRLTRSYGRGATLLVIENVPVLVCPHCGESYVSAETLHALERIKLHRRSLAASRPVAVATFMRRPASEQRELTRAADGGARDNSRRG